MYSDRAYWDSMTPRDLSGISKVHPLKWPYGLMSMNTYLYKVFIASIANRFPSDSIGEGLALFQGFATVNGRGGALGSANAS